MFTVRQQTRLRPFTFEDANAVVELFNACSQNIDAVSDTDLNEMMIDWKSPGFEVNEMIRIVEDHQGNIVGYIDIWDVIQPHVKKYIWGVIHPDFWDDDLYREMLSWVEKRSRERIALAPQDARIIMSQSISQRDIRRAHAMKTYGFKLVRHFFRMEINLDDSPITPILPPGLIIEPINLQTELKAAVMALETIFKDHWGHVEKPIDALMKQWQHYIKNDKNFDPDLWLLAKADDQIAGICRCTGKTVEDPNMGWINQLGVDKPWRRKGLGMALLITAFNEFYQRGKQRVGLGVDASSLTNATRLYEKAGMHMTKQYDTYEMVIRAGNNLMKT